MATPSRYSGISAAPQPFNQVCPGEPLIRLENIVKTFKTPAGEFQALKGVTACFYRGEFVSVVGKSGSGKSTLANMITGIDHPTSGIVRVEDTLIHTLDESSMSIWRGRNLGIVFQFFQLLPMLSLLENVVLPMDFCNMYHPDQREERAMGLLQMVGLEEFSDKLPTEISGGQQQSTAVARALANDPPIIIADEPTGNLDSRTAESVFGIFTTLVQQGKTIIMVTHDASLARRTGRTLLLSDGELINERVAHTFPDLSLKDMLWLTHQLKPQQFTGGQLLPIPGEGHTGAFLVSDGEVLLRPVQKQPISSASSGQVLDQRRLLPGDWLSYLNLADSRAADMELRVPDGSLLEVLSIELPLLQHWLSESETRRQTLQAKGAINAAP